MPVYNCELYIREALESILNQTYSDFEFLIFDDASTDATVEIIKSYNDYRIKLIEKVVNTGYVNSLNHGIKIAKGEYIARMDGDDISLLNRFDKQVKYLDNNLDCIACGCIFKVMNSNIIIHNAQYHEDIKIALLKESCIGHPTVMIRKKVLEENNIFYNLEKEPAEDYDLWVRLLSFGKLYNLQEVLFYYRNHEAQISIIQKDIQRDKATESRFNVLKYLGCPFTEDEEKVYKKIFSLKEKLTFGEMNMFFKIKDKLVRYNSNLFFDPKNFLDFLNEMEQKIIGQYFLGRKKFSPLIFYQYLKVKSKNECHLSSKEIIKLFIKSSFFYRVK